MKIIKQSHEILSITPNILQRIEAAGRTAYKSEDHITPDSLEKLIWAKVCKDNNKPNIESFGYARGYTFAMTYWEKIIDGMEHLRKKGVALVILAHSEVICCHYPMMT